ncbi:MAG: hypothetical protein ACRDBR_01335 [Metamycoplasmataceae bacterium]
MFLSINKTSINILINKQAYLDLFSILTKEINDIKLCSQIDIDFVKDYTNVQIKFNFKTKKDIDLGKKIIEIKAFLNNSIFLLQGSKPYNLIMNWTGSY